MTSINTVSATITMRNITITITMRSVTRLCCITHKLISVIFAEWVPQALKITLLSLIVVFSALSRAATEFRYNKLISKSTSRFVYNNKKRLLSSSPALECAICIAEFVGGEVGTRLERCGHVFHAGCVEKWIEHAKGHATCPLCRIPVVPESVMEEHRRRVKSASANGGGSLCRAFEEELSFLLLSGLRYGSCCQRAVKV